jgi:enoyl-CoA hydratase/carnithine racemase
MSTVLRETIGPVRILTLNRPEKLNAANLEMQELLLEELRAAAKNKDLRVLILTGAGRSFSAGGGFRQIGRSRRARPGAR